jgi:hypothetical protein
MFTGFVDRIPLPMRQTYQLQAAPVLSAKIQLEPLQEHISAK